MNSAKHQQTVIASAVVLACIALASVAQAAACPSDNLWESWSTLKLKIKSVPFTRGQVELRVSEQEDGRKLETISHARFFGATIASSASATLLDKSNGRARAYSLRSKNKSRRYTFGPDAYTVEKLKRERAELPWTSKSTQVYPYPVADDGVTLLPVYDYYGMILRLRDEPLRKVGDSITIHVATSSGPEAFIVSVAEFRSGSRQIVRSGEGQEVTLPSREMRLSVAPANPDSEGGFLDMEGEVEIWVEARTKTLIEIAGDVPKIPGRVRLVLSELD